MSRGSGWAPSKAGLCLPQIPGPGSSELAVPHPEVFIAVGLEFGLESCSGQSFH